MYTYFKSIDIRNYWIFIDKLSKRDNWPVIFHIFPHVLWWLYHVYNAIKLYIMTSHILNRFNIKTVTDYYGP